ncbi:MAG: PKD domain-containing protein [Bacteroidota bacterium]
MSNKLNEFDQLIKETYENHQFDYSPSNWEEIHSELDSASPAFSSLMGSIGVGVTMTAIIFASLSFLIDGGEGGDYEVKEEISNTGNPTGEADQFASIKTEIESNSDYVDTKIGFSSEETSQSNLLGKESENFNTEQKETVKALIAEAKNLVSSDSNEPEIEENASSIVKGCAGLTIDFESPADYGENARYLWNFGDGNFSNEENPTHIFNKEGIFDVSLSVTAVGSGQISSDVVQAMIEVHKAPLANFELAVGSKDELSFIDKSQNAENVSWEINGNSNEGVDGFLLSVADNTKYDITMVAQNAGSCADTLERVVHVIKAGNQFPKVFSTSYASNFAPGAIVDNGEVLDFRIFEKSTGNEVFKSNGRKGWSGKDDKGADVEKGMYQWMMVVDGKEATKVYKGDLNVQ